MHGLSPSPPDLEAAGVRRRRRTHLWCWLGALGLAAGAWFVVMVPLFIDAAAYPGGEGDAWVPFAGVLYGVICLLCAAGAGAISSAVVTMVRLARQPK